MTFIYEEAIVENNEIIIKKTDKNGLICWIPCDPNNSDYQEYLKQVSQSILDMTE